MSANTSRLNTRVLTAIVSAGLAASALGSASNAEAGPLRCDIQISEHGNAISLEAIVASSASAEGTYRLQVSGTGGGGSTDVSQGGEFALTPGSRSAVGNVTVAGSSRYVARLTVSSNAGSTQCTKRFSGTM